MTTDTCAVVYVLNERPGRTWVYPTHQPAEDHAAELMREHPDRRYEIHVCEFMGHPEDIHVRPRWMGGKT